MAKALLFVVVMSAAHGVAANFQVFTDRDGNRHVSNIAPEGFAADGTIKPAYDPNSIVYQYPLMLQRLRQMRIESELRAREEAGLNDEADVIRAASRTRSVGPKEGLLGLQGLIELEKRGGRWQAE